MKMKEIFISFRIIIKSYANLVVNVEHRCKYDSIKNVCAYVGLYMFIISQLLRIEKLLKDN